MKNRNIINIDKWPRTISHKKSMEQIIAERQKIREDKIKRIKDEVNELLTFLENEKGNF